METEKDGVCITCKYYNGNNGTCRNNPPTVISVQDNIDGYYKAISYFPEVYEDDWCGKWESK